MKYVQAKAAQMQSVPLISAVINAERDSATHVKAVALIALVAHRNICFLCREFFGVRPNCRMNSNRCLPSLLCA